jgi:hypothetical protein
VTDVALNEAGGRARAAAALQADRNPRADLLDRDDMSRAIRLDGYSSSVVPIDAASCPEPP